MITILSGTNRPSSTTRRVAALVEGLYETLGIPTAMIDLCDLPESISSPRSYAAKPEEVQVLSRRVLNATGLVIVVPEYNGSFPGILKLFIDHLPFPQSLAGQPVSLVGVSAGMWGALRAVEQLQAICTYRNAHIFSERVFIPHCNSHKANDPVGGSDVRERLLQQAIGFSQFVKALTPQAK